MIVRMKKVTLLCIASARDSTLESLRGLGVLHLHHVKPPAGGDVDNARGELGRVQRALEVLPKHAPAKPSGRPAEDVVKDIWDQIHLRKEAEQALEVLTYESQRLEPYGSFDPASIRRLAEKGITIKLFHAARGQEVAIPDGAVRVLLHEDRNGTYFAVAGRGEFSVDAQELRLPEKSLDEVNREIAAAEARRADTVRRLAEHAGNYPVVAQLVDQAEEKVRYLEARAGMGAAAAVAYLRGYCPVDALEQLRHMAALEGWGLIVDDPARGEAVPTLIRNPRWIRPIETIYHAFGILPGYEEIDISVVFLAFLSIFFAMIVGDAGYGLIFLAFTFWLRRKFPGLPPRVTSFLKIMSLSTIVWGVMTGSYFFIASLPAPLRRLKVGWLGNEENVKYLAFLIGTVHLTIAHAWNALRTINSLKALAQVGWICTTWTMFFAACTLVLGMPFPSWILPVGVAGVVLIVFFMTPPRDLKTEWFNHALLPLNLVSNFIDVVSYIRLYAVGVAGAAVAGSFHDMALSGVKDFRSGLIAALIIFIAHALNLAMSAMSVLVHGVRLNVLEFTNHIGMQWSGFGYRPFARRASGEGD